MLAKIYGVLCFVCLVIIAPAAAESDMYITAAVSIGLTWIFFRQAWYESGMSRKKNSPR